MQVISTLLDCESGLSILMRSATEEGTFRFVTAVKAKFYESQDDHRLAEWNSSGVAGLRCLQIPGRPYTT